MLHRVFSFLIIAVILTSCDENKEAIEPPTPNSPDVSGTLPVMYIDTESRKPVVSKDVYLNATYRLDPMGAEGVDALG